MSIQWNDPKVDIVDVLEGNLDGPYVTVLSDEAGNITHEIYETSDTGGGKS